MKTQLTGRIAKLGDTYPRPNNQPKFVDLDSLVISNDPLPKSRSMPDNKYAALFGKMKIGSCIVCESSDTGKIGHAMNVWIKKHNKRAAVRTTSKYEKDGKGRVWLVEA